MHQLRLPHTLLLAFAIATLAFPAGAAILRVKADAPGPVHDGATWATAYRSVSAALTIAAAGDEVWVAAGTYTGPITLKGGVGLYGGFAGSEENRAERDPSQHEAILDGARQGTVVTIAPGAGPDTVLDGFTIENGTGTTRFIGTAPHRTGGGIEAISTSAVITNNHIRNNTVEFRFPDGWWGAEGGGVYLSGGAPLVARNTIEGNVSRQDAGVYCYVTNAVIRDNVIRGNNDGITMSGGAPVLVNNTCVANAGYGILASGMPSSATVVNNIIAYNVRGVALSDFGRFRRNNLYRNSYGDFPMYYYPGSPIGTDGNISRNPRFTEDGYHLRPDSPCVDAGEDPATTLLTDIDGQPRVQGERVDIGADEFDFQTTVPPPPPIVRVHPDGNDTGDGSTWAAAKRTVAAAALALEGHGGEVWAAAGTYVGGFDVDDRVALYGGFAGTETVREQRDPKARVTILDGGRTEVVVRVLPGATDATVIDGFTIQNGYDRAGEVAGGISIWNASPVVSNNIIGGSSGGLLVRDGSPIVERNEIINNQAVRMAGVTWIGGNVTLRDNRIAGNVTTPWHFLVLGPNWERGAGVVLSNTSGEVARNAITGNRLEYGPYANNAIGTGAGLYIAKSNVTVKNNTVSGNQMSVYGIDTGSALGVGIAIEKDSTVVLANNLVADNSASAGGDFWGSAAGVGVFATDSTVTLRNNTIVNNVASVYNAQYEGIVGGGLYLSDTGGSTTAVNNIVSDNTTGVYWRPETATMSHNDIHGNGAEDFSDGSPDPTGVDGNISVYPQFAGTSGGGYRLSPTSPAIDAGQDAAVPAGDFDLDGNPRIAGSHVDMGAYEFPGVPPVTIADVASVLRAAAGLALADPATLLHDADKNGLDIADAIRLARKVSGLDANL